MTAMRTHRGSHVNRATGHPQRLAHPYLSGWLILLMLPAALWATSSLGVSPQGSQQGTPEVKTQTTQPTFKVRTQRNVVLVPVVVRDARGHAVGNLRKEDFRVFDDKKAQTISSFEVETGRTAQAAPVGVEHHAASGEKAPAGPAPTSPAFPGRYLAFYFDDAHLDFKDLVYTRDAAERYLGSAANPADRVALITSSGQGEVDFTGDSTRIHQALVRLRPRPITPDPSRGCPPLTPYEAFLIVEQHDLNAVELATKLTIQCRCGGDPNACPDPQGYAQGEARQVLSADEVESEATLREVDRVVKRIATLPGQRSIVLVSPGFLTQSMKMRITEIADHALRAGVIINALDSRGLYAPVALGDASSKVLVLDPAATRPRSSNSQSLLPLSGQALLGWQTQVQTLELGLDSDVMAQLAEDTGGVFFQNSNDYATGFRVVGALPEVYYVLGFSPENPKFDGRFHSLKVTLALKGVYTLQARRGYFAPRGPQESERAEHRELEDAVFNVQDVSDFPLDVQTQFFKTAPRQARLSILMHVDLRALSFHKENGKNLKELTFVTALFDHDGKYLEAKQKVLELHVQDTNLKRLLREGITGKETFDVKPGAYLVREVVRDAEEGRMSTVSRRVKVSF